MAGTVSVGLCWLAKGRAATPPGKRRGPVLANRYVGLACESRGMNAVEADSDALDLAYRLLDVHVHLLNVVDVVDPRGIQGAGCLCDGFG